MGLISSIWNKAVTTMRVDQGELAFDRLDNPIRYLTTLLYQDTRNCKEGCSLPTRATASKWILELQLCLHMDMMMNTTRLTR